MFYMFYMFYFITSFAAKMHIVVDAFAVVNRL